MAEVFCKTCKKSKLQDDFDRKRDGNLRSMCRPCGEIFRERYKKIRGKFCLWCAAPTNGTVYCEEHKAITRDKMREKRSTRPPRNCKECGIEVGAYKSLCPACSRNRRIGCTRRWSKERVLKIYEAYGGASCGCCGEKTFEFLTLDHVNNDGADHRRELGGSGSHVYAWIIRKNFPSGYRVLCYNCNAGRYRNGGICPHEMKVATA
jgi:hypothetical protein